MYTVAKNQNQGRVSCPLLIKLKPGGEGTEYSGKYDDKDGILRWMSAVDPS